MRAGFERLRLPDACAQAQGSAPDRQDSSRAKDKRWSKQRVLIAANAPRHLKIFEGPIGADAAARRAIEKTELHEIRLVNFLDGGVLFIDRRCDRAQAHRPAAIFFE